MNKLDHIFLLHSLHWMAHLMVHTERGYFLHKITYDRCWFPPKTNFQPSNNWPSDTKPTIMLSVLEANMLFPDFASWYQLKDLDIKSLRKHLHRRCSPEIVCYSPRHCDLGGSAALFPRRLDFLRLKSILGGRRQRGSTQGAAPVVSATLHSYTDENSCTNTKQTQIQLQKPIQIQRGFNWGSCLSALWRSCNGKLEIGIFHFLERNISGIFGHG